MNIIMLGEAGVKDTAYTPFFGELDPACDRCCDLFIGQVLF